MQREEVPLSCPYCGERLVVLVDPEDAGASYVEDCQVCCRPMILTVRRSASGELSISARGEDE